MLRFLSRTRPKPRRKLNAPAEAVRDVSQWSGNSRFNQGLSRKAPAAKAAVQSTPAAPSESVPAEASSSSSSSAPPQASTSKHAAQVTAAPPRPAPPPRLMKLPDVGILPNTPQSIAFDQFFASDRPLLEVLVPQAARRTLKADIAKELEATKRAKALAAANSWEEEAESDYDAHLLGELDGARREWASGTSKYLAGCQPFVPPAAPISESEQAARREASIAKSDKTTQDLAYVAPFLASTSTAPSSQTAVAPYRSNQVNPYLQAQNFLQRAHNRINQPTKEALDKFFNSDKSLEELIPKLRGLNASDDMQGLVKAAMTALNVPQPGHSSASTDSSAPQEARSRIFQMHLDAETGTWHATELPQPASSSASEDESSSMKQLVEMINTYPSGGDPPAVPVGTNSKQVDFQDLFATSKQAQLSSLMQMLGSLPGLTPADRSTSAGKGMGWSSIDPTDNSAIHVLIRDLEPWEIGRRPVGYFGKKVARGPRQLPYRGSGPRSVRVLAGDILADSVKRKRKHKVN